MRREVPRVRRKATRQTATPRSRNGAARKKQEQDVAAAIAALDELRPVNPKSAAVIALLKSWLADESGYDEQTWPKLKKAIDRQRDRVGARRLFDE